MFKIYECTILGRNCLLIERDVCKHVSDTKIFTTQLNKKNEIIKEVNTHRE